MKRFKEFHVLMFGDRFEFLPVTHATQLRGILQGMDIAVEREKRDRDVGGRR